MNRRYWEELAAMNFEGANFLFDEEPAGSTRGTLGRVILNGTQVLVQDAAGEKVGSCSMDWGSWSTDARGVTRIFIPMIGTIVITPVR